MVQSRMTEEKLTCTNNCRCCCCCYRCCCGLLLLLLLLCCCCGVTKKSNQHVLLHVLLDSRNAVTLGEKHDGQDGTHFFCSSLSLLQNRLARFASWFGSPQRVLKNFGEVALDILLV
jgi:hypothetical protein